MAIVQISRIQHRRGIRTLLPQLAAGELGWAVDTQELFIGNGTLEEGAPETGNTKVLTEDDDLLSLATVYTYRGNTNSPTVTGVDNNSPVTRSIKNKLDDFASVKDFGAVGDGVTDDTDAINRAIANLATTESTGKEKRKLFFPGGVYKVSGVILLYPFTNMAGDGMKSTFIRQTDATEVCLMRTCDRNGNTSASIGDDGAARPEGIEISNIQFETQSDNDLIILDQCEDVHFRSCHFVGSYTNQDGQTNNKSLLTINSTTALPSKRMTFSDCSFESSEYCVKINDDVQDIFFSSCEFFTSYRAFNLAETADGSTSNRITGPTGVVITSSRFNNIDAEAVKIWNSGGTPRGNIIANCSFRDVGANSDDSSDVPALQIDTPGNFTHHNYFYRTDNVSNFGGTVYHEDAVQGTVTLADNQTSQETGIEFNTHSENHLKVEYVLSRGGVRQSGTLHINGTSASMQIDDEYYRNADPNVTFTVNAQTGKVLYTTASTGTDATFKYRVIHFL